MLLDYCLHKHIPYTKNASFKHTEHLYLMRSYIIYFILGKNLVYIENINPIK